RSLRGAQDDGADGRAVRLRRRWRFEVAQRQEGQEGRARPYPAQGRRRVPRRDAAAAPGRWRHAGSFAARRDERRSGLRPVEVQAAAQKRPVTALHLAGTVLPGGEHGELWITGGKISFEPVPGAETLVRNGFLVPGLVDAHCHPGIGIGGPVTIEEAVEQAIADRDAGTLLIRDCGLPIDVRPLQRRADLPTIIRAGRHLALAKRYIPGLGVELDDPAELPAAVAEQARDGDGWVKLVGDWIDRGKGDLAPLWPDDVLAEAVKTAHDLGARVTAHVFGEDALPGLIAAGIDCLEHGTALNPDQFGELARNDVALVPTLINIDNFPAIADRAAKYPAYAAHMRALHA